MKFEELGKGIVKRKERRVLGLFIDGTGLDRATRRINRKVDMSRLVRGVTAGSPPVVARYYTLIPYEDDSRQRAFLDAVDRAGLEVIVKRLPPKGITRQVAVDVEIASDIVAFALGHDKFGDLNRYRAGENIPGDMPSSRGGAPMPGVMPFQRGRFAHQGPNGKAQTGTLEKITQNNDNGIITEETISAAATPAETKQDRSQVKRIATIVCPSRDLSYPISLIRDLGVDTVTADFGQFNTGDILKSAAKWIDLSDSETIWR